MCIIVWGGGVPKEKNLFTTGVTPYKNRGQAVQKQMLNVF